MSGQLASAFLLWPEMSFSPFFLDVPVEIQVKLPVLNFPHFRVGHELLADRHTVGTIASIGRQIFLRFSREQVLVFCGCKHIGHALMKGGTISGPANRFAVCK